MGMSVRVFLVDDNDSLQRISMARLDRLLHFDRRESLPQYAGKRVRCAMAFLEVAGRRVLAIQNIEYSILTFDAKGRIDKKEWEKGMRLGMELLPLAGCTPDITSENRENDARGNTTRSFPIDCSI